MASNTQEHFLIVLHGAIGDVVRGSSLIPRLRKAYPDCKITWAVEPLSFPIVKAMSGIDQVVLFNRGQGFSAYYSFIKELRKNKYTCVLDLQRHFKSGITSFLSGGKKRIGFNRKNAKEFNWIFSTNKIPVVDNFSSKIKHYHLFLDTLGLPTQQIYTFPFVRNNETEQSLENRLSQLSTIDLQPKNQRAVLIVGSSWKSRFWFVEHYQKLIKKLWEEKNIQSIIIGGKGERLFVDHILQNIPVGSTIDLVEKTSLVDLFSLFNIVSFAVGSDSGPMHIASAVSCPVVSLWGATSYLRSAPYGSESYVLQSPVGCSPCYRRECPGLGQICMEDLSPEIVFAQINRLLVSQNR